jgi:hypothetical protein
MPSPQLEACYCWPKAYVQCVSMCRLPLFKTAAIDHWVSPPELRKRPRARSVPERAGRTGQLRSLTAKRVRKCLCHLTCMARSVR